MFERILVPLDGSSRAEQALPAAARLARASGGSILLVQVVSLPIDYSGGLSPAPLMTEQLVEMERAEAVTYLTALAQSSLLAGVTTHTEVMFGIAAQEILAVAESRKIDLIVIGSHGRTGFSRWVLGSVAHTLVHESRVPVLVLHSSDDVPSLNTGRALSTLVPLDGSPLAETALSPAAHLVAALAAPGKAELHLAQVVKAVVPSLEEGIDEELNETKLQQANVYLADTEGRLLATMKELRLTITWSATLEPDVAATLVDMAEHGKHDTGGDDLIAISTHGRNGLSRWVMGSVTDRVLNVTRLPMLIVRPQQEKQG